MTKNQKLFTERNITKAIISFAVPAVITILVSELYNMIDTFFLGRYVGANAVGALSIVFPIQRLFIAISMMIGVGMATFLARSFGEKDYDKIRKVFGNAIALGVIIFILLMTIIFCFRESIVFLLGASNGIYPLAMEYVVISLIGLLFMGITNILCNGITALGYPKIALISTSVGALTNIILDYFFVALLGIGVKGAAIATVISQIVGFAYTVYRKVKLDKGLKLKLTLSFDMDICRTIILVGFSSFIVEISDAVIIFLLNNILIPIGGYQTVIIVGAITRISMIMYVMTLGVSSGVQPLTAYAYGAGNYARVKEIIRKTVVLATTSSVMLWAGMMIFTKNVIGTFIKDPFILAESVKVFRITMLVFPIVSVYYVAIYYYQAINQPKTGFFLSVYRELLLFIPVLLIMVKIWGLAGAWLTYPITDIISAVTGGIYLFRGTRFTHDEKTEYVKRVFVKELYH